MERQPLSKVKRWCKKENKYIKIDCTFVVRNYNQHMGGVDICKQQMECYRPWFKTRKWTLKLILHFLDLSTAVQRRLQGKQNSKKRYFGLTEVQDGHWASIDINARKEEK